MNKKILKKIVYIFTAISLCAGSLSYYFISSSKPSERTLHISKDHRFQAEFPADPKESSASMEIAGNSITFNEMSATDQDALFAVSYIDFPGHWKLLGTKKLLTKSFGMFVESQEGVEEVLSQQLSSHNGHPSLLYRLKQNGKEIQGKFVIAGNTLYRIAVTYPIAAAEKARPEAFLESFQARS